LKIKIKLDELQNIIDTYDFILLTIKKKTHIETSFTEKLGNRRGIIIGGEKASQLLDIYSLYEFSDKIIIGSFDEPNGRKLRNLLESGIATEDELINDVILGAM